MNNKNILMPLEDIMGESFGKYSKYIIQERAIPDARDGLKPVHRRILYAMYKGNNIHSKPYRKSAKTVGDVIGNYHPHGDSSIYDAMVRMSQTWKLRYPLVDMHGNNGSIDDDPAAAMRYTEARMSFVSSFLISDLEKDTVKWSLNFDDTELEPTVLPSKFPNLLVNGSSGIASGYATEIPPHNLTEVMDGLIFRVQNPESTIKDILKIIKGPDFPTGGIITNISGVADAFQNGKGRILLKAKTKITDTQIIITEIPFVVYKASLIKEMHQAIISNDISAVTEVRDETDKDGLRIVIDIKKTANAQNILNFLFQKTRLQTWYNYNIVSIINKKPALTGILPLLDSYISHQKNVLVNRLNFSLNKINKKLHILEGLIIAIENIDEIIKIIRKSKSKTESKTNIIDKFSFTEEQAEAIVNLRLYRLSSTDVNDVQIQKADLEKEVNRIKAILKTNETINNKILEQFEDIKEEIGDKRKTKVQKTSEVIKYDSKALIDDEPTWISVTKAGYIKRSTLKSHKASKDMPIKLNDQDAVILEAKTNTLNNVIVFFSSGKYTSIPIYKLTEAKWREKGNHISTLISSSGEDNVIFAKPISNFHDQIIVMGSKNGMVKRTNLLDLELTRWTKPSVCMKLANEDEMIGVYFTDGKNTISFISNEGYVNKYIEEDIPISGPKTKGVKGMNLKDSFSPGFVCAKDTSQLAFITSANQAKRIKFSNIPNSNRNTKGTRINKLIKTNPQKVIWFNEISNNSQLQIITQEGVKQVKGSEIALLKVEDGNNKFFNSKDLIYSVVLKTILAEETTTKPPATKKPMPKTEIIVEKKPKAKEINLFDILEDI